MIRLVLIFSSAKSSNKKNIRVCRVFIGKHYDKHVIKRAEWGKKTIMSITKYLNKARELINAPIGEDIQGFTSKNGFTFRYNIVTNEFATAKPDGLIETLYRPTDGMSYWLDQIKRYK